jgi:solute carrier family 25 (mitochondrial iron transporter), member 28/37
MTVSRTNDNGTTGSDKLMNVDWEEWDKARDPFWVHCLAGSIAGVIEHGALYPLDTVRTHIQVCASWVVAQQQQAATAAAAASGQTTAAMSGAAPARLIATPSSLPLGVWQTIRYLVNNGIPAEAGTSSATATLSADATANASGGYIRLWRGVQTVVFGCAPSHALYFASYEGVKSLCTDEKTGKISPLGSSAAGAAATIGHDCVMTPMDTIKQRLQLGHYNGSIVEAFSKITASEGYVALYRSLPVTLATKIPYHMIMVTTNEQCKQYFTKDTNTVNYRGTDNVDIQTVLISGSIAGLVASAGTTPLDRIKTTLQTQQLYPNCSQGRQVAAAAAVGSSTISQQRSWLSAATTIYHNEGFVGFFRGLTPRVLSHTPAVAISWTAYEIAKRYILTYIEN